MNRRYTAMTAKSYVDLKEKLNLAMQTKLFAKGTGASKAKIHFLEKDYVLSYHGHLSWPNRVLQFLGFERRFTAVRTDLETATLKQRIEQSYMDFRAKWEGKGADMPYRARLETRADSIARLAGNLFAIQKRVPDIQAVDTGL